MGSIGGRGGGQVGERTKPPPCILSYGFFTSVPQEKENAPSGMNVVTKTIWEQQ